MVRAVIFCLLAGLPGWGAAEASVSVTSPEHPRAWFMAADFEKLSQSLRWDRDKQALALYVTYSLHGEWPKPENSDQYRNFRLAFPQARLSGPDGRLVLVVPGRRAIPFATIRGERVIPDAGVQASAHRHDGVVTASLVVGGAN